MIWSVILLSLILAGIAIQLKAKLKRLRAENRELKILDTENKEQLHSQKFNCLDAFPEVILVVNKSLQLVYIHPLAQLLFSQSEWSAEKLVDIKQTLIEGKVGIGIKEVILVSEFMQWIEEQIQQEVEHCEKDFVLSAQASSWLKSEGADGETAWLLRVAKLPEYLMKQEDYYLVHIHEKTEDWRLQQTRQDFIAHASHELKTPLTILLGYLEILTENGSNYGVNKQGKELLDTAYQQGEKLQLLTQQMLNLSKFESSKESMLTIEDIKIKDIFEQVQKDLQSLIKKQDVKLSFTTEGNITKNITIKGDNFYWQQIIYNLFENALKQNKTGALKIELNVKEEDEHLIISVIDNGVGISSMDVPYIFNRFYSVDKNYTGTKLRGAGLGLSIVKRALLAHNAHIEVESIPGERTAFMIYLDNKFKATKED